MLPDRGAAGGPGAGAEMPGYPARPGEAPASHPSAGSCLHTPVPAPKASLPVSQGPTLGGGVGEEGQRGENITQLGMPLVFLLGASRA